MPNLTPLDLRDPEPPAPGERERALVAERAHALGRRRRLVQGGGALALVAAVAVSVAALVGGGTSGPGGNQVQAASSGNDTTASAPAADVTTAPATVATTVPAAPADPAPAVSESTPAPPAGAVAPAAEPAPAAPVAPATFTLSGSVSGNPVDTTVTLMISGPGGEFTTTADGAGNFSLGGLTAGDYTVIGQWTGGGASQAQRFGTVSVNGDSSTSFAFST